MRPQFSISKPFKGKLTFNLDFIFVALAIGFIGLNNIVLFKFIA